MKSALEIVPVKWIDQVLAVALEREPTPLPEEDAAAVAPVVPGGAPAAVQH